jgi:hypothetical protein
MKVLSVEAFLGVFSGLTGVVIAIKDSYFNKDRRQEGGVK